MIAYERQYQPKMTEARATALRGEAVKDLEYWKFVGHAAWVEAHRARIAKLDRILGWYESRREARPDYITNGEPS